jgi:hypothetical protein
MVIQNISEYAQLKSLSRERERVRERSDDEVVKVSRSDGLGRGGRTGHWLAVEVLRDYRGVRLV